MQLERQTLSQAVSAAVLERIRSGEFAPGDRLPTEKMLMNEYSVGRNSVREAVQALVTLGLVEVRPGRGATVLGIASVQALDPEMVSVLLKEEAVDDLYAFRLLLEVAIASCAAQRASADDLEEIGRGVRAYEFAYSQHAPVGRADDAFHLALARASHNSVYATMLEAVTGLIANARRLSERVPWAIERAVSDHQQIYEAVKAHDSDTAQQLMRRHIETAMEAIRVGRTMGDPVWRDGVAEVPESATAQPDRLASGERRRPRATQ